MTLLSPAVIRRSTSLSHLTRPGTFRRLSSSKQPFTGVPPSYGPIGVDAALKWSPKDPAPKSTLFTHEFNVTDRVALITGANRGLGLEMALALAEAGARAVYCVDLPKKPGEEWEKTRLYAKHVQGKAGEGRLEYIQGDVTNQEGLWKIAESVGAREGRLDIGVASAGLLKEQVDMLTHPGEEFKEVMDVNVNGVLFTAQALGQQMVKFGNGGSIMLMASLAGSVTLQDNNWVAYHTSKSALLQMGRNLACELAPNHIRVNTISPGYIYTRLTAQLFDADPQVIERWSSRSPSNRIGRPDELRGVVTWLASDASTYCTGSDIIVDGGYRAW